jgi:hypothetical protein
MGGNLVGLDFSLWIAALSSNSLTAAGDVSSTGKHPAKSDFSRPK